MKPNLGASHALPTTLRMSSTLNIAGEKAGMKNRRRAFSMPMNAAASATSVRNGSVMRVRVAVSSSLPGTAANSDAYSRVSGVAKMRPSTTSVPVTISSAFSTSEPRRHAAGLPPLAR